MRRKSHATDLSSEEVVKDIRRATRKRYSAEEKIRIVLDGLRGERSAAWKNHHTLFVVARDGEVSQMPLLRSPDIDPPYHRILHPLVVRATVGSPAKAAL